MTDSKCQYFHPFLQQGVKHILCNKIDWCKNLGNKAFRWKLLQSYDRLLKTTSNLKQLSSPLMDLCNFAIVWGDIWVLFKEELIAEASFQF